MLIAGALEVSRWEPPHLEWTGDEVLLCGTGNDVQSLGIEHDGREDEKKNMCVCVCLWLGHFAIEQKRVQHCKSTVL